jgi:HlyD family secretion protein
MMLVAGSHAQEALIPMVAAHPLQDKRTDFVAPAARGWRRVKHLRTGLALLGAVAIAAGVLGFRALGPAVTAVPAARREIVQRVVVSGRVLPSARVSVGSLVPGVILAVAVKEGDHVEPGALLVQLDDADARAALAQAQAGLAQAAARLRQLDQVGAPVAREAHRQADANVALAQLAFERQAALVASGSVAPAQLDDARRALDVARSQHDAAEVQDRGTGPRGADHALAFAAHAQAAAAVAAAEVRLSQARLTAATAATVLTRAAEPGDIVQPGRVLLGLARDGERLLSVQPDEKNLADLHLDQKARAAADAFPHDPFDAVVSYLAPSVDPQRGTVEVRLTVPAPPPFLRPDMTISVDVEVGRRPAALVVPAEAVHDIAAAAPWVLLSQEHHAVRRPVTLGLRGEGACEVTAGLTAGDLVILPGSATVEPGSRVRVTAVPAR